MGPGQYPQDTRADFDQEAVGSSSHRDHRAPQVSQDSEPNTLHKTYESRMVAEPWLRSHDEGRTGVLCISRNTLSSSLTVSARWSMLSSILIRG